MRHDLPTIRAIAALSLTQLIGWGATFWLPAIIGPTMGAELGLELPLVMAGPSIMLVTMAVVSWPLGRWFERLGARPIMAAGSALGAAGLLLLGLSNGLAAYAAAWLLLGLAGACMLSTPAQIAVTEIAGDRARQAMGIMILAGGLTSTIIWPLAAAMQAQWGWRGTVLIFAATMLLICLPLHWATLARKPRRPATRATASPVAPIDRPRFALLALSFAANGFFTWGFALSIIILLQAVGLDPASALAAGAFIGIAQWAGRMLDIVVGHRISGLAIAIGGSALFPLGLLLLMVTRDIVGAIGFATLYGIAGGITAVSRATLPLQIFPPGAYARTAARLALPLNLSFAAAPPAFAAIVASAGPRATLLVAIAFSLVSLTALVGLWVLQRRSPAPTAP